MLIAPPVQPEKIGSKVLLAWNRSPQAARALACREILGQPRDDIPLVRAGVLGFIYKNMVDPSVETEQHPLRDARRVQVQLQRIGAGVVKVIEDASQMSRVNPGDVLVTGTPGGVGAARTPPVFMDEGDLVEVTLSGVGELRNRVVVG